ncbi:MAG TPA: hypothetical protein VKZ63_15725 [Kofleriaceae bacterium]|nr:hypothetical protein [Kofleriaceae bacterium]
MGGRRAVLGQVGAGGLLLLLAALAPAFRGCDGQDVRPVSGLLEADWTWLLAPHAYGLLAALAAALLLVRWEARLRALEIALVGWALAGWMALAGFFVLGAEGAPGVALGVASLLIPAHLAARGQGMRWRAVRALWLGAVECVAWYGFWIALEVAGGDSEALLRWGTYLAAAASLWLLVAGRRLEALTPRWRRGPDG